MLMHTFFKRRTFGAQRWRILPARAGAELEINDFVAHYKFMQNVEKI